MDASRECSPDGIMDFTVSSESGGKRKKSSVSSLSKSEDDITDGPEKQDKSKKKKGIAEKIKELQTKPTKNKNKGLNASDHSSEDEAIKPAHKKHLGVMERIRRFGSRDDLFDISNDDENPNKKKNKKDKKKEEKSKTQAVLSDNEISYPAKPSEVAVGVSPTERRTAYMSEGSSSDDEDFTKDVLVLTNRCRRKHGVRRLKANKELNALAYDWARMLARDKWIQDRYEKKYGKNIYKKTAATTGEKVKAEDVVNSWYQEINQYTYGENPENLQDIKNATQLLWKNSKEIGIAKSRTIDKEVVFVAAYFSPKGNVQGEFTSQILPLRASSGGKSNDSSSETSSSDENDATKKGKQPEKKAKSNIFNKVINKIRRNSDDDLHQAKRKDKKLSSGHIGHRHGKYVFGDESSNNGKHLVQSTFFVGTPADVKHESKERLLTYNQVDITNMEGRKKSDSSEENAGESHFTYGAKNRKNKDRDAVKRHSSLTEEVMTLINDKNQGKIETVYTDKTSTNNLNQKDQIIKSGTLVLNRQKSSSSSNSSETELTPIGNKILQIDTNSFQSHEKIEEQFKDVNIPSASETHPTGIEKQEQKRLNISNSKENLVNDLETPNRPQKVGPLSKLKNYFHKTNDEQSSSDDEATRIHSEDGRYTNEKHASVDIKQENLELQNSEKNYSNNEIKNVAEKNIISEDKSVDKKTKQGIVKRIKGHFKPKDAIQLPSKSDEMNNPKEFEKNEITPPEKSVNTDLPYKLKEIHDSKSDSSSSDDEKAPTKKIPIPPIRFNKASSRRQNIAEEKTPVSKSNENFIKEMKEQFRTRKKESLSSEDSESCANSATTNTREQKLTDNRTTIFNFTGKKPSGNEPNNKKQDKRAEHEVVLKQPEVEKSEDIAHGKLQKKGILERMREQFQSKGRNESSASEDELDKNLNSPKPTKLEKDEGESGNDTKKSGFLHKIKHKTHYKQQSSSSDEEKSDKIEVSTKQSTLKSTTPYTVETDTHESTIPDSNIFVEKRETDRNFSGPRFLGKIKGKVESKDVTSSSDEENLSKVDLQVKSPIIPDSNLPETNHSIEGSKDPGFFEKLRHRLDSKDGSSSSDEENNGKKEFRTKKIVSESTIPNTKISVEKQDSHKEVSGTGFFGKIKGKLESKDENSSSDEEKQDQVGVHVKNTIVTDSNLPETKHSIEGSKDHGFFEKLKHRLDSKDESSSSDEENNRKKELRTKKSACASATPDTNISVEKQDSHKEVSGPGFFGRIKGKLESKDETSSSDEENLSKVNLQVKRPLVPDSNLPETNHSIEGSKDPGFFEKLKHRLDSKDESSSSDKENNGKREFRTNKLAYESTIPNTKITIEKQDSLKEISGPGFFGKIKGKLEWKDESSSSDEEKQDKVGVHVKNAIVTDSNSSEVKHPIEGYKEPGFFEKLKQKLDSEDESSSSGEENNGKKEFRNKKIVCESTIPDTKISVEKQDLHEEVSRPGFFGKIKEKLDSKDASSSSDEEKPNKVNLQMKKPIVFDSSSPETKIDINGSKEPGFSEKLKYRLNLKDKSSSSDEENNAKKEFKTQKTACESTSSDKKINIEKQDSHKEASGPGIFGKIEEKLESKYESSSSDDENQIKVDLQVTRPLAPDSNSQETNQSIEGSKDPGFFEKLKGRLASKDESSSSDEENNGKKEFRTKKMSYESTIPDTNITVEKQDSHKGVSGPGFFGKIKGKQESKNESSSSDEEKQNKVGVHAKNTIVTDSNSPETKHSIEGSKDPGFFEKLKNRLDSKDESSSSDEENIRKTKFRTKQMAYESTILNTNITVEKQDSHKEVSGSGFFGKIKGKLDSEDESSSSDEEKKDNVNLQIENTIVTDSNLPETKHSIEGSKDPGFFEKLKHRLDSKDESSSSDEENNRKKELRTKKSVCASTTPDTNISVEKQDSHKKVSGPGFFGRIKGKLESKDETSSSDEENLSKVNLQVKRPLVPDSNLPETNHSIEGSKDPGFFEKLKHRLDSKDGSSSSDEENNGNNKLAYESTIPNTKITIEKQDSLKEISGPGFFGKIKGKLESDDESSSSDEEKKNKIGLHVKNETKHLIAGSKDPGIFEKMKHRLGSKDDSSSSDEEINGKKKFKTKTMSYESTIPDTMITVEKQDAHKEISGPGVSGKMKGKFKSKDESSSSDEENQNKVDLQVKKPNVHDSSSPDPKISIKGSEDPVFFEKWKHRLDPKDDSSSSDEENNEKKKFSAKKTVYKSTIPNTSSTFEKKASDSDFCGQRYFGELKVKLESKDVSSSSDEEVERKVELNVKKALVPDSNKPETKHSIDVSREPGFFEKLTHRLDSKDGSSSSDEENNERKVIRTKKTIYVSTIPDTKISVGKLETNKDFNGPGFFRGIKGKLESKDESSSSDEEKQRKVDLRVKETTVAHSHMPGTKNSIKGSKDPAFFEKLKHGLESKDESSSSDEENNVKKRFRFKKTVYESNISDTSGFEKWEIKNDFNCPENLEKLEGKKEANDEERQSKVDLQVKPPIISNSSMPESKISITRSNEPGFFENLKHRLDSKDESSSSDEDNTERIQLCCKNTAFESTMPVANVDFENGDTKQDSSGIGFFRKIKGILGSNDESSSSDEEHRRTDSDLKISIAPDINVSSGFLKIKNSKERNSSIDEEIKRKIEIHTDNVNINETTVTSDVGSGARENDNLCHIHNQSRKDSKPYLSRGKDGNSSSSSESEEDVKPDCTKTNNCQTSNLANHERKETIEYTRKISYFGKLKKELKNESDDSSSDSDYSKKCYTNPEKHLPGNDRGKRISILKQVFENPNVEERKQSQDLADGDERRKSFNAEIHTFENNIIKHMNFYRKKHGAMELTLDYQLSKYATERAHNFASGIVGNIHNDLGENIFVFPSAEIISKDKAKFVVENWYNSKFYYEFGKEPDELELKSGPFTQLVWKASKTVGVGRHKGDADEKEIVVVVYKPSGNIRGQFRHQVEPE